MALGRQLIMSSVLVAVVLSQTVLATTEQHYEVKSQNERQLTIDYDFDLDPIYRIPESNWVDMVTMRRVPRGSLYRNYKGPTRLVLKVARNHVRRFARTYYDHSEHPERLSLDIGGGPTHPWWTREWFDSLPSEKRGAPSVPYVHTYGSEITWKIGPLIVSNTLKIKLDYIAVLKLDVDPQPIVIQEHPVKPPKAESVSIDVEPPSRPVVGRNIKIEVKVRPNINLRMPRKDEGWWSFIRKLSLQANLDVFIRNQLFVQAEAELCYKPGDGISLKVGIVLGVW